MAYALLTGVVSFFNRKTSDQKSHMLTRIHPDLGVALQHIYPPVDDTTLDQIDKDVKEKNRF